MLEQTVGFLGAGKMAEALSRGILAEGLVAADRIVMSDADPDRRTLLADELGVRTVADNAAMVEAADVVVLALKPADLRAALPPLAEAFAPGRLVVSIAAGVTLAELGTLLPDGARIVRVMPNTPALVGSGAAGFALGPGTTPQDRELVASLLGAVGVAFPLPERLLDAVTGLSGSGPAFVALVIEALADGGVLCGLPRHTALALAAHTVLGAARLVVERDLHPALLKDMVASPGGTTIAGLQVLEEQGLRAALIDAVDAATRTSQELGRQ
ncbi:MAG: pyrroline-5-carboxylate reductase [Candidatus Brocadiia bacterium]